MNTTRKYKPGQLINTKEGLFRVIKGRGSECEFRNKDGRCINPIPCRSGKLPFDCIYKKVTPDNDRNNARICRM